MSATPPSQDPHPVPRQSSPQAREPPQQTVTQQLVSHMMQRIWADIPDNHNFQLPFEHPLQYLATKNAYASVPEDFVFHPPSEHLVPPELSQLIYNLRDETKRGEAIQKLVIMKDSSRYAPHMGSLLWYSSGTMSLLVEEIIAVYPYLDDAEKHQNSFANAINCLQLLQPVALSAEICGPLVNSRIPLLTIPFLRTEKSSPEIITLKEMSMWLHACIVQHLDMELTYQLLENEILRYCRDLLKAQIRAPLLPVAITVFYAIFCFEVSLSPPTDGRFDQHRQSFLEIVTELNVLLPKFTVESEDDDRTIFYFVKFVLKCYSQPKMQNHMHQTGIIANFQPKGAIYQLYSSPDIPSMYTHTQNAISLLISRVPTTQF